MSMQVQAQMYIVVVSNVINTHPAGCDQFNNEKLMTVYGPTGTITYTCLESSGNSAYGSENVAALNAVFNNIIAEGYKLVATDSNNNVSTGIGGSWYFAVPWTTVGLTEIDSSELDFRISPNPANDYINVEVDFKSQPSELVLISEQGYIYFKKDISNILSGQEFTLDIANIPAGKYAVTVKDDKQYLNPKKIIIL